MNLVIVRYAEVGLKGKNRNWFEKLLIRNIKIHLAPLGKTVVSKIHGRIIVECEGDIDQIKKIIGFIPGIANFSVAETCTHDLEEINTTSLNLLESSLSGGNSGNPTFKATARRSEKSFPMNSMQLAAHLGSVVLEKHPELKVDLSNPEIELGIEIWPKNQAIVYLEKTPGQGGLPSGSAGPVISFISGGIDSPVASWMMMKRGCTVHYLHFHSYPFIGEQSRQKVIDLVKHLSRFQPISTLMIVPFADIQKEIQVHCQEKNRTVLYRRMMYRVAETVKSRFGALAYITGEAVGQVASQTLENLACTSDAASLPILRPLVGMAKSDIINLARQIGTFDISVQPFPDCCTVFQPQKPEIRGRIPEMREDETNLALDDLIKESVDKIEVLKFQTQVQDKFW